MSFTLLLATLPLVVGVWWIERQMPIYGSPHSSSAPYYELHHSIFVLLMLVALARAFVGIAVYGFDVNLWYVQFLFPIRFGGINWGLPYGIPFLIACLAVLWKLDFVVRWLEAKQRTGLYLFLFALLFGWAFGAIQGGPSGLTSFFHSPNHIHDAILFEPTIADILAHDARRYIENDPHYLASHFKTHPPFLLAIWSIFEAHVSMEALALLCTLLFAATFCACYAAIKDDFGKATALRGALLFLFTPALLIYGVGGDDVITYALWTWTLCLAHLGIRRENGALFAAGIATLIAAMSVQYASIVLLPAMFALPSGVSVRETPFFVWRFKYWIAASIACVILFWVCIYFASGFNYLGDFRAYFDWYHDYSFAAMIESGRYVFALGSRLIHIFDFLLLAGPAIFLAIYVTLRKVRWRPLDWDLAHLAVAVLAAYVTIRSDGAGETARGWGGLYVVMLFGFLARFFSQCSHEMQQCLMRYTICWGLALQVPINFTW
jgi:hypothetical protein